MVLGTKMKVVDKESENWHFSFLVAPDGEALVVLGSPSLLPLAAGGPRCW